MELLRFWGPRARPGASIAPQQLLVSDVLAAGHRRNAILIPRRGTKSTSVIATGLGRAQAREDYRVGVLTLTSGKAGRARFIRDVAPNLERLYPEKDSRPMWIRRSAGQEGVDFVRWGGGSMTWLSTEDDLRGEAFDLVILDEAGEPQPDKVESVLGAAMPTLITRPGAQIVVVGTAGDFQQGNLLFDWIEQARADGGMGVVDYSSPRPLAESDIETWETTRELLLATHPGIGNVVADVEVIRDDWKAFSADRFLREYLSVFGTAGEAAFLDLGQWSDGELTGAVPSIPEHHRMALAVEPETRSAALVAVWREADGTARLVVVDHGKGAKGVERVRTATKRAYSKFRLPIVHDGGAASVTEQVAILKRATNPKPRFDAQTWPQVSAAAVLMKTEIDAGRVKHFGDETLTAAVRGTKRRGTADVKRWAFGRVSIELDDITPLEAASLALRAYDEAKPKRVHAKPQFAA